MCDTQCESPSIIEAIVLRIYNKIPSRIYTFFQDFRFGLVGCKGRYSPNPTIFLIQRDFLFFFRLVWLIVSFGFMAKIASFDPAESRFFFAGALGWTPFQVRIHQHHS